jgi:hypothetical protein
MTTSEQLERDAEAARTRITATLDELRGRMTPGQVVDQLVDYMRDGSGATFVRNFRSQVVSNPVPVTLVGAGLAWLALASRRSSYRDAVGIGRTAAAAGAMAGEAGRGLRDRVAAATGQWTDSATETGQDLRDTAAAAGEQAADAAAGWSEQTRSAAARLGERAGETSARMQAGAAAAGAAMNEAAASAYDAAARGSRHGAEMVGRAAGTLSETATAASRNLMDFFTEQPLVLAGIGLALGALLGASIPVSETEDRLMGEASDATKRDAKDFAQQQFEKAKAVGQEAVNAASRELDQQIDEAHRDRAEGASKDASQSGAQEAHADATHAAESEAGREAPLVPSHDGGVMASETHGAAGNRERE